MRNDISRQWAPIMPLASGEVVAEQARAVEAAGLAGIQAIQVYSAPMMTLSYCAAVTSRVQLATAIANVFIDSPFNIAMTAVDLDRLCDGRLVLGVGPSVQSWSEGFYGATNYGKPVEHLRETIEVIRLAIAKSHTGELTTFDGKYHKHDWTSFQGALAPPVREKIPIWIAANQMGLTRLAGEVADGFFNHPIWSLDWTLKQGLPTLNEAIKKAGRQRSDVHWNAWYWVAVNEDRAEAIADAKGAVAFYAGIKQYEPMFASQGFAQEAWRCQEALDRKDLAGAAAAVTDEMAETFVILGTADECRKKVEQVWDVADSFTLVPPLMVSPEKFVFYLNGIGETFYG